MGPHPLSLGDGADHLVILSRTPAEPATLLEDIIGIFPVIAFEAHFLCQHGHDLPIGLGIPGGIVEFGIQTDAPFRVGPGKIVLTPTAGGEYDVGILRAKGIPEIDLLVCHDHPTAIDTFYKGVDNRLLVEAANLMPV